ncbi:hypothetical protein F5ESL0236_00790 [Lactobacillus sp. ESL0236]|uniref:hypothetical protein n=1 Tax=unclassified Lactobacillus TaxID=2620435 RepID=UPI000EFA747E|nr:MULTISPECIES: hypothetical protein [unclassified Lactobacillus]RMC42021.1 hypothetical protein F5ESL0237_00785 [Lactobacillus sp. ESL0237]RMC45628.1 hypothetical protein F5ESL0234_00785 [Lactobacillus sp. ESL0234]RMC47015.1 hypothetical protein F5ESL0236_00790 [Lactobacillus sp. ESL0236]
MKDKNKSKKIKYFIFIHIICTILIVALLNKFDTEILMLIHGINIFSKFSDDIIKFVYLFVIIFIFEMVYQKIIKYFFREYK